MSNVGPQVTGQSAPKAQSALRVPTERGLPGRSQHQLNALHPAFALGHPSVGGWRTTRSVRRKHNFLAVIRACWRSAKQEFGSQEVHSGAAPRWPSVLPAAGEAKVQARSEKHRCGSSQCRTFVGQGIPWRRSGMASEPVAVTRIGAGE